MIFNEMSRSAASAVVNESPYDLGISGALMHVYENECNYNALMKAAALSELKYYNETGGDLFVQEAGALKNFAENAKKLFLKIIEKIKSIAKKFVAMISQYTMKDKDFVKKYQKDLLTRDLKDFTFDGYQFPKDAEGKCNTNSKDIVVSDKADVVAKYTNDDIISISEKNRGHIVAGSAMTESEFRDALKEVFYGDKDEIKVNIREEISIISDTENLKKKVAKQEKEAIKAVEDMIKDVEKQAKDAEKSINVNMSDGDIEIKQNEVKAFNNKIAIYKAFSNDLTVYFGVYAKSVTDRNRQAKAICVKALSYKHESAGVAEGAYGDIFSGVEII